MYENSQGHDKMWYGKYLIKYLCDDSPGLPMGLKVRFIKLYSCFKSIVLIDRNSKCRYLTRGMVSL